MPEGPRNTGYRPAQLMSRPLLLLVLIFLHALLVLDHMLEQLLVALL
jgi:hypothetical protein